MGEAPVTILFTDVEGSTDLLSSRGDAEAIAVLRACDDLVRQQVAAHGGRAIKSLGDGLMASFPSPITAVACALAIDSAMTEQRRQLPADPVRIRMGLHTGMAAEERGDLFGAAVNAAARIAGKAQGDEVLISEVVRQLCGTLPGVAFEERGQVKLRGFPQRWRLYRVERGSPAEGLPEPTADSPAVAAAVRIELTGRVRIEAGEKILEGRSFPGRQVRLAFAYLVIHRRSSVPHDELAEALWPGEPPPSWQRNLSVIASRVRAALGDLGLGERVLSSAQGCYHLDLPADTRVDVEEAAAATAEAEAALRNSDWADAAGHAQRAAELTRRPFLPGDEGPWVDEMRSAQRTLLMRTLDAGAQAALTAGDGVQAVALGQEAVELDPFRETGCQQLIRALAAVGDRARALQVYERCRRLLADELGVSPSAETEAVYLEVLRADRALSLGSEQSGRPATAPSRGHGAPELEVGATGRASLTSSLPIPGMLTGPGRIFVGRDREMDFLQQRWRRSVVGELLGVVIAGEPGIGKTRLAAELAARAHAEGATVLAGRCDEDLGVPYQPFVEALRHLVDHTPVAELADRLGRYGGELARLVPELGERLPSLPPPLRSDPETERYRLFDAVAAWLAATSAGQPVLLVLDDMQWATKPTLLLLRHVLRSSEPMRLLVAITYRDTEVGRTHPLGELLADLRRQEGVERIVVSGLEESEVAAFLEQAAGHELGEEKEELARVIHRETEGNAFFVREVVRHLIETGGLVQRERRWVTGRPVAEMAIPEGVRDVVGRRLSRLSATANHALAVAAVAGQDFELAVVQRAGSLDEDTVVSALDEAVSARLITDVPGPVARHRFAHALVRTALYEELTAARRLVLHRRVAEAIETCHAGGLDDHLPSLAHHWARAGAPAAEAGRAVDYAARAGDRALIQLAYDEAVQYYRQALGLLAVPGSVDERRLELLISLGDAQRRAGDPEHRRTLLDAARLAHDRCDTGALARAALATNRGFYSLAGGVDREVVSVLEEALDVVPSADSTMRARLMATLAAELLFTPHQSRRDDLATEALAMARRLGDTATLGHVLNMRGLVLPTTDPARRQQDAAELLAIAAHLNDPALAFFATMWEAIAALTVGAMREYSGALDAMSRLANDLGQPVFQCAAGIFRSSQQRIAGRLDEAWAQAQAALEFGRAAGMPDAFRLYGTCWFWIAYDRGELRHLSDLLTRAAQRPDQNAIMLAAFGLMLCELDRSGEAREVVDHCSEDDFAAIWSNATWLFGMTILAEVCARVVDVERAVILYERLKPYANLVACEGPTSGCVDHYLGLLASSLDRLDEADAHFQAAADMHRRMGAPTLLARTRLEWAQVLLTRRGQGDAVGAGELLGRALATARQLGLATIERRAVALLDEVAQR